MIAVKWFVRGFDRQYSFALPCLALPCLALPWLQIFSRRLGIQCTEKT
jgi:hypothetical protein